MKVVFFLSSFNQGKKSFFVFICCIISDVFYEKKKKEYGPLRFVYIVFFSETVKGKVTGFFQYMNEG